MTNSKNNKKPSFEELVNLIKKGHIREYWLLNYVKDNYNKLGFDQLSNILTTGYGFRGVYKGKNVVVEVERAPKYFVQHRHNPKEVDILIVMTDDETDRNKLPKTIIVVDTEDFAKYILNSDKHYVLKVKEEKEKLKQDLRKRITRTLAYFINLLEEQGIISSFDIVDALGISTEDIAVIYPQRKLDYEKIVSSLTVFGKVFIYDLSRQRANYIRRRLEKTLGQQVVAIPAVLEDKTGYYFSIASREKTQEKVIEELGIEVEEDAIIRAAKRIDYHSIRDKLEKYGKIVITNITRQRSYYICKKLGKLLNRQIKRVPVVGENIKGYLFWLE